MDTLLIGQVMREWRAANGWSRAALAMRLGRSESWVKRAESGLQPVDRLSDIEALTRLFGIELLDLLAVSEPAEEMLQRQPEPVRRLVTAVTTAPAAVPRNSGVDVAEPDRLSGLLAQAWACMNAARPHDAAGLLAEGIPRLLRSAAGGPGSARARAGLASAFGAAGLVLSHTPAKATSQIAATAAMLQAPGDEERTAAALIAATVMRRGGRLTEATAIAESVLEGIAASDRRRTSVRAAECAAHLQLAVLAATTGQGRVAADHLEAADRHAAQFDTDRTVAGIWVGPTAVAIRRMDVAIHQRNPARVLRIARGLDMDSLPVLSRERVMIRVAAAQWQTGDVEAGGSTIVRAATLAPQMRGDRTVSHLLRQLFRPESANLGNSRLPKQRNHRRN